MLKLITSLISLLSLTVLGQEPADTPDGAVEQNYPLVYFSIFVWSEKGILTEDSTLTGIPRVFYRAPGGSATLVRLYKNKSTPLLPYQGPQPLVLFDIETLWTDPPVDAPPGTKPTMEKIETPKIVAEIPRGVDRAMLIVYPDRRGPSKTLQTIVLPYDSDEVRPGMSRVLNGTNRPLALKFADNDKKILKLQPGKSLDFTPNEITDNKYPRIFIYGIDETARLRLLHTNRLHFKDQSTQYYIVFPEGMRRVRIKSLGSHEQQMLSGRDDPNSDEASDEESVDE